MAHVEDEVLEQSAIGPSRSRRDLTSTVLAAVRTMPAVCADNGECSCSEVEHTSVAVQDGRIFDIAAAVATSLAEGEVGAACAVVLRPSGGYIGVGDGVEEGDSLHCGPRSFGDRAT